MGQAKLRGTQSERIGQAEARKAHFRPKMIKCNRCETENTEIMDMDTRGLPGVDGVYGAVCKNCKSTTFAFRGQPEAVAKLALVMNEEMGGNAIPGSQLIT